MFSPKGFTIFCGMCFSAATVYLVAILLSPMIQTDFNIFTRHDYVFMLFNALSGLTTLLHPFLVRKLFGYAISGALQVVYFGFVFAALFLGTLLNFYYHIPPWDIFLHFMSGIVLGILAYSIADYIVKADKIRLRPLFVTTFAFCFAKGLGAIWEIYEFGLDVFLGTNTQVHTNPYGVPFVGQAALSNTMIDMIANGLGALVICIWGHRRLKHKGWPNYFTITRTR